MKPILIGMAAGIFILICLTSFVTQGFSPSTWPSQGRFIFVVLTLLFGAAGGGIGHELRDMINDIHLPESWFKAKD